MDNDERVLWQRWHQTRDAAARDALIIQYSPWARMIARDVYMRMYLLRDAWHDCVQNALIGLIEAMDRFDPDRGVSFQPYARHRVRGAVFDGMRALRGSHMHGRGSFDPVAAARERMESLDEDSGSDPLDAFIATTVGLGLGFLLDAHSMPGRIQPPDAYAELEKEELSAAVADGMDRLSERERMILMLHYYHQIPFVDIASQLAITKGRVSQLHKRALERLRLMLRERIEAEC
ncbi:MAG: sigma-70 family RNA polymerase sigma factor [Rhodanobacter sp.]